MAAICTPSTSWTRPDPTRSLCSESSCLSHRLRPLSAVCRQPCNARTFRYSSWFGPAPPSTMALDASRSTALSWQFPPPRWAQGLSTGATNSEWKRQWRQLHHWQTEDIARQLSEYWQSVPQHDKDALVTLNGAQFLRFNYLNARPPCAVEMEVRAYFDAGIAATHQDAVSNDNGQPLPSDPHSVFQPWHPNVVYGESDYLLVNQQSRQVKGVCEAKSPWNVGPAQIDQVLLGTKS